MNLYKRLTTYLIVFVIAVFSVAPSTSYAKQERSQAAKDSFKASHPCPSNGVNHGPCPGYVIDHVTALACGGADSESNMQWQSVSEGKAKDKWERKGCSISSTKRVNGSKEKTSSNSYFTGPRGGCFTYSGSGKKRYVDHSYCRG